MRWNRTVHTYGHTYTVAATEAYAANGFVNTDVHEAVIRRRSDEALAGRVRRSAI